MRYLLDTNVISELRKGSRCDPAVAAWEQAELIPQGGAVSVITIGEIRKGIDLIGQRDPQQASRLESWLRGFVSRLRRPHSPN
jgi:predicted nucleic acid-binding protein